jgi:hypothetical protein
MSLKIKDIGFWDYTCPQHGSLERYTREDWDILLDDMAAGGLTSFVLGIKWLTTGYRSRLPWLDQDPECSAIASDNALIHYALQGARQRGMRTWLLLVVTIYPSQALSLPGGTRYWTDQFVAYDLDAPGLKERIAEMLSEVLELFGGETDGLVIETEFGDTEAAHRIPLYNEWAASNNRPDFISVRDIRLESRMYPFHHWRDFTTARRVAAFQEVEKHVRGLGFTGKLASISEIDNQHMVVMGNTNLNIMHDELPHWPVITYDSIYDRRRNRLATADLCIRQPRSLGLETLYLTRGVMTFNIPPELGATTLQEQWRMELEDAAEHRPDTLWFMGTDCRLDGMVCSSRLLPQWGFEEGRAARLHLIEKIKESLKNEPD